MVMTVMYTGAAQLSASPDMNCDSATSAPTPAGTPSHRA